MILVKQQCSRDCRGGGHTQAGEGARHALCSCNAISLRFLPHLDGKHHRVEKDTQCLNKCEKQNKDVTSMFLSLGDK